MKMCFILIYCCFLSTSLIGREKVINKNLIQYQCPAPDYLFKILSFRHWQAIQNRGVVALPAENNEFIRLSTEEELEDTITESWSNAKEIVILRFDRKRLEGKLVQETNSEGITGYYRLYDGNIPFNAIVESKTIYNHPSDSSEIAKLKIVEVGDPVLRKPARDLSRDEILSSEIQELIENMKETNRAAPGVGLAATQIGKPIQLAVIEDIDHSHLTPQQIAERNRYPVPFHVIINPRIFIEETSDKPEFFEGCLSVPTFIGIVPRAESVRVECLNERAEPVVIHAKGWYARILQHEIDHLNGTLFIDRAISQTLVTDEGYDKFWKGMSIQDIKANLVFNENNPK